MTWQEFDRNHAERYGKIMRREMTLAEALVENEADWRALIAGSRALDEEGQSHG